MNGPAGARNGLHSGRTDATYTSCPHVGDATNPSAHNVFSLLMEPTKVEVRPLIDQHPDPGSFRDAVVEGLQKEQKDIPSKFLYDERGSALFEAICDLDVYYPTDTEIAIMQQYGAAMADAVGPRVRLLEYGSGSSRKTRLLLDRLEAPALYVPIDISRDHLVASAEDLAAAYPHVRVQPVCADYTSDMNLPAPPPNAARTVVYYPGSTIGNFQPHEARQFLESVAEVVGPGGGLLIGVDLQKDLDVLRAAYNDPEGVTAAFNKNLLLRINRELDGTFDLDTFAHRAPWNDDEGCIEMHLVSQSDQTVTVDGHPFEFEAGESIRTEYSYKFTLEGFAALAADAGFTVDTVWTDDDDLFSVQYATVDTW